jgi:HSP20 family protein
VSGGARSSGATDSARRAGGAISVDIGDGTTEATTGSVAGSGARISSGIAGGDLLSGGIAASGALGDIESSTPPSIDVEAELFGVSDAASGTGRASEGERDVEPEREGRAAVGARSASRDVGAQGSARVAGRGRSPGLSAWLSGAENPLSMMRRMQDDLDRVFRAFGIPRLTAALAPPRELEELLATSPALAQSTQWSPQIEVFERGGNLVVHADLPAVRREDVEVEIENDVLTIRGQRRQENREAEGGYRRTERTYGTFLRQIPLPEGIDPSEIEATYQDGVLEVIVPTPRDDQRPRRRVEIR